VSHPVARGSRIGTTTIGEPALGASIGNGQIQQTLRQLIDARTVTRRQSLGQTRVVSFSHKWVNNVDRTALPTPMWPETIWRSGAALRVLAKAPEAGRIHFLIPGSQVRSLPGPFTAAATSQIRMVEPCTLCDSCTTRNAPTKADARVT
jgi:hypothetical protein